MYHVALFYNCVIIKSTFT